MSHSNHHPCSHHRSDAQQLAISDGVSTRKEAPAEERPRAQQERQAHGMKRERDVGFRGDAGRGRQAQPEPRAAAVITLDRATVSSSRLDVVKVGGDSRHPRPAAPPAVAFDRDELKSCRTSIVSLGGGSSVSALSSSAWEEGSASTSGTEHGRSSMDTEGPGGSGIPQGESDDEDGGDDDDDEDDVFEAADNFDLNAVDLCVSHGGSLITASDPLARSLPRLPWCSVGGLVKALLIEPG